VRVNAQSIYHTVYFDPTVHHPALPACVCVRELSQHFPVGAGQIFVRVYTRYLLRRYFPADHPPAHLASTPLPHTHACTSLCVPPLTVQSYLYTLCFVHSFYRYIISSLYSECPNIPPPHPPLLHRRARALAAPTALLPPCIARVFGRTGFGPVIACALIYFATSTPILLLCPLVLTRLSLLCEISVVCKKNKHG
jgi:hypothetical protein